MIDSINSLYNYIGSRNKYGIKPGLDRVSYLLEKTGHPEKAIRSIHVAGTNGKGSTIQFLQDVFIHHDYRVGVFTSPSFTGIEGHFFLDGEQMTSTNIIKYTNMLLPFIEELDTLDNHPTEFEILTVIAFLYFRDHADIAIIETGMGGRYDTTNCFVPVVSIITNIAMDHIGFLGSTLGEIAYHKAGIIKERVPVITGNLHGEALKVIEQEAQAKKSPITRLGKDFFINEEHGRFCLITPKNESYPLSIQLKGSHQLKNAAVAYMALSIINHHGFELIDRKILDSFGNTVLPGRFEQISCHPSFILDSAHNVAGIQAFMETVKSTNQAKQHQLIFAGFKDKQLQAMLEQLATVFTPIIVTTFDHNRAATIDMYKEMNIPVHMIYTSDWKEIIHVMNEKENNEIVYITGSLHFITMVRNYLKNTLNL